jgi:hypothetical protein
VGAGSRHSAVGRISYPPREAGAQEQQEINRATQAVRYGTHFYPQMSAYGPLRNDTNSSSLPLFGGGPGWGPGPDKVQPYGMPTGATLATIDASSAS